MKKKVLIYFATLIMMIGVLVGCSDDTGQEESSGNQTSDQEAVELRYTIWDNNQAPAYQEALDIFEEENPHIQVQLEVVPWGEYWTNLKTQAAGQTVPDLFWTYVAPIPELSELNVMLDITEYIEQDNIDLSQYNDTLVNNLQYNGEQYGLPKDWDAIALFYNKGMVEEAGFSEIPSDLEWNPNDGGSFVEFLQELTFDSNGNKPYEPGFNPDNIQQYGFNTISFDMHHMQMFIESNGGTVLDEDGNMVIDSQEAIEAMQFVHDLIYKYHVAPSYTEVETTGGEALFYGSNVAVWMEGSWMMNPVSEEAGFEWGTAPLPAGPNGRVVRINGLSDSIYIDTPHPDEAWEVAKFLAEKTTQDILGETGTVFPALEESIPKYVEHFDQKGLDVNVFVESFEGQTVGDPASVYYDQINEIWRREVSLAYSGEKDLIESINAIIEDVNALQ